MMLCKTVRAHRLLICHVGWRNVGTQLKVVQYDLHPHLDIGAVLALVRVHFDA